MHWPFSFQVVSPNLTLLSRARAVAHSGTKWPAKSRQPNAVVAPKTNACMRCGTALDYQCTLTCSTVRATGPLATPRGRAGGMDFQVTVLPRLDAFGQALRGLARKMLTLLRCWSALSSAGVTAAQFAGVQAPFVTRQRLQQSQRHARLAAGIQARVPRCPPRSSALPQSCRRNGCHSTSPTGRPSCSGSSPH